MKYYPIKQVSLVESWYDTAHRCQRLNDKNPGVHFKPQQAGSGYQVVAAKLDGTAPLLTTQHECPYPGCAITHRHFHSDKPPAS